MFNYHVNGESQGYGYARGNYPSFISAPNGESQYEQLRGRVGYVVVSRANGNVETQMMQGQLLTHLNDTVSDPPSHYQLLYVADDRSLAAYALVPGARIVGETAPNTQVTLNTSMTANSHSFSYEWTVTAGEDGRYAVTTPYPGQYRVGGNTVEVPSSAVMNGTQVTAGERAIK
jgi:dolichyl-diphosphooligosaccharide--protein glycosyltransferase